MLVAVVLFPFFPTLPPATALVFARGFDIFAVAPPPVLLVVVVVVVVVVGFLEGLDLKGEGSREEGRGFRGALWPVARRVTAMWCIKEEKGVRLLRWRKLD